MASIHRTHLEWILGKLLSLGLNIWEGVLLQVFELCCVTYTGYGVDSCQVACSQDSLVLSVVSDV